MNKTPTGFKYFDEKYGGTCKARVLLLTARAGSGKTLFSLQFLKQGLELGECVLILSANPSADVALQTEALGINVEEATLANRFFLLNYNDVVPGRDREQDIMLPPDGFIQLKELIEKNGIRRVALDTVLPWMNLPGDQHLPEHIFSFARSFERMNVTTLFTLPKPVSPPAHRLRAMIENVAPVSVMIDYDPSSAIRRWSVCKYIGETADSSSVQIRLDAKRGIIIDETGPASANLHLQEGSQQLTAQSEPSADQEEQEKVKTTAAPAIHRSGMQTPFANAMFTNK